MCFLAHTSARFLTPVLTQLFFPKPLTTFLIRFCRGERRKYARKKSCFNRGSNSQPAGHESNTLTTEPPGRGLIRSDKKIFKKLYHIRGFVGKRLRRVKSEIRLCVYTGSSFSTLSEKLSPGSQRRDRVKQQQGSQQYFTCTFEVWA